MICMFNIHSKPTPSRATTAFVEWLSSKAIWKGIPLAMIDWLVNFKTVRPVFFSLEFNQV